MVEGYHPTGITRCRTSGGILQCLKARSSNELVRRLFVKTGVTRYEMGHWLSLRNKAITPEIVKYFVEDSSGYFTLMTISAYVSQQLATSISTAFKQLSCTPAKRQCIIHFVALKIFRLLARLHDLGLSHGNINLDHLVLCAVNRSEEIHMTWRHLVNPTSILGRFLAGQLDFRLIDLSTVQQAELVCRESESEARVTMSVGANGRVTYGDYALLYPPQLWDFTIPYAAPEQLSLLQEAVTDVVLNDLDIQLEEFQRPIPSILSTFPDGDDEIADVSDVSFAEGDGKDSIDKEDGKGSLDKEDLTEDAEDDVRSDASFSLDGLTQDTFSHTLRALGYLLSSDCKRKSYLDNIDRCKADVFSAALSVLALTDVNMRRTLRGWQKHFHGTYIPARDTTKISDIYFQPRFWTQRPGESWSPHHRLLLSIRRFTTEMIPEIAKMASAAAGAAPAHVKRKRPTDKWPSSLLKALNPDATLRPCAGDIASEIQQSTATLEKKLQSSTKNGLKRSPSDVHPKRGFVVSSHPGFSMFSSLNLYTFTCGAEFEFPTDKKSLDWIPDRKLEYTLPPSRSPSKSPPSKSPSRNPPPSPWHYLGYPNYPLISPRVFRRNHRKSRAICVIRGARRSALEDILKLVREKDLPINLFFIAGHKLDIYLIHLIEENELLNTLPSTQAISTVAHVLLACEEAMWRGSPMCLDFDLWSLVSRSSYMPTLLCGLSRDSSRTQRDKYIGLAIARLLEDAHGILMKMSIADKKKGAMHVARELSALSEYVAPMSK